MTTYRGSCHCGGIRFAAEGELEQALECNCSICSRKGSLLWFIPRDRFTLRTPDSDAATYTFNENLIQHRFWPKCGIHPFAYGVDLPRLAVQKFDGRSL